MGNQSQWEKKLRAKFKWREFASLPHSLAPQLILTTVEQQHTHSHSLSLSRSWKILPFASKLFIWWSFSHFFHKLAFYPIVEVTGFTSRSGLLIFKQLRNSLAIVSLRLLFNHPKARKASTLSCSNFVRIQAMNAVFWALRFCNMIWAIWFETKFRFPVQSVCYSPQHKTKGCSNKNCEPRWGYVVWIGLS